jgi:hypothetical protein
MGSFLSEDGVINDREDTLYAQSEFKSTWRRVRSRSRAFGENSVVVGLIFLARQAYGAHDR